MKRELLGLRISTEKLHEYRRLSVEVMPLTGHDAAKELADLPGSPRFDSCRAWAEAIKEATGATTYYDNHGNGTVTITWQRHQHQDEAARWIAPSIESTELRPESVALLGRLLKAMGESDQPMAMVSTLLDQGAVIAKYLDGSWVYVQVTDEERADALGLMDLAEPETVAAGREHLGDEMQTMKTITIGQDLSEPRIDGVRFAVADDEAEGAIREAYAADDATFERVVTALCEMGRAEYLG